MTYLQGLLVSVNLPNLLTIFTKAFTGGSMPKRICIMTFKMMAYQVTYFKVFYKAPYYTVQHKKK